MNYCWFNKSVLIGLLLWVKLSLPVVSQQLPLVQIEQPAPVRVAVGEEQQFTLSIIISEGYHIQANQPDDENLIPTALTFAPSEQISVGNPAFPLPTKFRMLGTEEDLLVFGNVLEVEVLIKAAQSAKSESHILSGKLHYQACDSLKCYFPRNIEFTVEVQVE